MFLFYIRIYRSLYIYTSIYVHNIYIYILKYASVSSGRIFFFFFYSIWEKNYIYKHDDTIINTYKYKYYYYILIGTQDAAQNFVPFVGSDIYIYIYALSTKCSIRLRNTHRCLHKLSVYFCAYCVRVFYTVRVSCPSCCICCDPIPHQPYTGRLWS